MARFSFVFFLCSFIQAAVAHHQPQRSLTDEQWRADLTQLSDSIKGTHFKPFAEVSEEDFDVAIAALKQDLPGLPDAAIIMEMARIVALMRDGHTRLHLPREYPMFALEAELGHSGTPPPHIDALRFRQLPVRFGLFEDGLFIIAAAPEHVALIGHKVARIGHTPTDAAIERVKSVSFHENDSRARLLAPDRLALVEVLKVLGIASDETEISILTRSENGPVAETMLSPYSGPAEGWVEAQPGIRPRWTRHVERDEWFVVDTANDAIYVQVNRFSERPPRPYSEFVAETLVAARAAGVSRYVIDLRHNSGGTGAWTIPFVTGLTRCEFNRFGRLYILIGGTTFSAAQQFLHLFEAYSYALFVGEPSGAKPSHYGDARRIVLDNSGLSLRVSTIYWHSWLANDFRDAIQPHIDAPLTSADFFAGRDPGWEAAISYQPPDSIAGQIEEQLRQGKNQNGLLLYQRYQTDGTFGGLRSSVPELMTMADSLLEDGVTRPGMFVYFLLNQTYPENRAVEEGLARAQRLVEAAE